MRYSRKTSSSPIVACTLCSWSTQTIAFLLDIIIFQSMSRVFYDGSKNRYSGIVTFYVAFFHWMKSPTLIHMYYTCQPWKMPLKSSLKSMPLNLLSESTTLIHKLFSRSVMISKAYQSGLAWSIYITLLSLACSSDWIPIAP